MEERKKRLRVSKVMKEKQQETLERITTGKDRTVPDGIENGIIFEDPKQVRSGVFLSTRRIFHQMRQPLHLLREAMSHAWTGWHVDAGSLLTGRHMADWTHTANAATVTSCAAAMGPVGMAHCCLEPCVDGVACGCRELGLTCIRALSSL